jgi:hypothetical protein
MSHDTLDLVTIYVQIDKVKELAIIVSEFFRQGIIFSVEADNSKSEWIISLKGF